MVQKAIRGALFGAALSMLLVGGASADDATTKAPAKAPVKAAAKPAAKTVKPAPKGSADEVAVMETSKGRMVAEFWEKDAPKTVANFKTLARKGFFDGTGFHRIIKGFMIQGGDPNSKNPSATNLGTGGPGYTIADEFNSHPHVKGVLSMANTGTPNSAGSQFFVMHGTASSLDGHYTAFGHLIAGMDVLDKIANSQTGPNPSMPGENSKPIDWTTLKSVKIMPRNAWQASAGGSKKAEASMKSSMGGGTGMDMKAAGSTSAPATSSDATGHPGHDTVEKAKESTQPTTPSTDESGK
jgi:peptidyl-prolyl cis-trans isomerase B (cyclophilin B)